MAVVGLLSIHTALAFAIIYRRPYAISVCSNDLPEGTIVQWHSLPTHLSNQPHQSDGHDGRIHVHLKRRQCSEARP